MFEIGRFYQHLSGTRVHIIARVTDSAVFPLGPGSALTLYETPAGEVGAIVPGGEYEQGWFEITPMEFADIYTLLPERIG